MVLPLKGTYSIARVLASGCSTIVSAEDFGPVFSASAYMDSFDSHAPRKKNMKV